MPNTACLVGLGASAICGSLGATPEDLETARRLVSSVGIVVDVPENLIDVVTGLSGSGPAYVYTFLDAMIAAGISLGLPISVAQELTLQTVIGASEMARQTGRTPAELRDEVISPGGTTMSGLAELEARDFRGAIIAAVAAAARRARELGGQPGR
jgi:pyrroline-5-carboxylate reductase